MAQRGGYCPSCKANVLASSNDFNHVLHLLLFLFCCGVWLPVWLILWLAHDSTARCTRCGCPVQ